MVTNGILFNVTWKAQVKDGSQLQGELTHLICPLVPNFHGVAVSVSLKACITMAL